MLTLPEQWIILALDEKKGNLLVSRSAFQCIITGGMLMELAIAGRLRLEHGKKVMAVDVNPTGDTLLDKALGLTAKSKKPKTVLKWMVDLTMQDSRVIESFYFKRMVDQGILKRESHLVLDIFKSNRYFPESKDIRREILHSLKGVIALEKQKDKRPVYLLGLVSRSGYIQRILDKDQTRLFSQDSDKIFSISDEHQSFDPLASFYLNVLNAITHSQQPAGTFH